MREDAVPMDRGAIGAKVEDEDEALGEAPDIILANPAMPAIPPAPFLFTVVALRSADPSLVPVPLAFFVAILPQSLHELHTLQTFPSGPRIRPGGKFGCVSLVVRSGALD